MNRATHCRVQDAERYITAAQGAVRRAAALTHRLLEIAAHFKECNGGVEFDLVAFGSKADTVEARRECWLRECVQKGDSLGRLRQRVVRRGRALSRQVGNRATLIEDVLDGQYSAPGRIVARDVTEDIANELREYTVGTPALGQ